jgi:hypothetical protein
LKNYYRRNFLQLTATATGGLLAANSPYSTEPVWFNPASNHPTLVNLRGNIETPVIIPDSKYLLPYSKKFVYYGVSLEPFQVSMLKCYLV